MTVLDEFLDRLQAEAGLDDREAALDATRSVFTTLRDRLTPEEADDLEAQLASELKAVWRGSGVQALVHKVTGPERLSYQEFLDRVAAMNGVSAEQARELTRLVFRMLKERISGGEAEDVASQLPKKLKVLWLEA